jgi:hypothetical protein
VPVSFGGLQGNVEPPPVTMPTIVHMDMLDADKLLPAIPQPSKNHNLPRICSHRSERRDSPFCGEGGVQLRENLHSGAAEWQAFSLDGAWTHRNS